MCCCCSKKTSKKGFEENGKGKSFYGIYRWWGNSGIKMQFKLKTYQISTARKRELLCVILLTSMMPLSVSANTCLLSCNPGDALSESSCVNDYLSSVVIDCPSGWTAQSSSTCRKSMCANGNVLGSYFRNPGMSVCTLGGGHQSDGCRCYWGSRAMPAPSSPGVTCFPSAGGPGGFLTSLADNSGSWCYFERGEVVSCSGKYVTVGGVCEIPGSSSRQCSSGGTLRPDGVTCRRTYAAVDLVGATRCGSSYAPSSTGCSWCPGITVCLPTGSTCYADCYAATASQTTCTRLGSSCQWCGTSGSIGVCQPQSVACFGSCLAATADPSACAASSECKWCDTGSSIGVCQPKVGGVCYTQCLQSTAESDVCDTSQQCKWCNSTSSIGVCQPNAGTCYATCLDASITAEAAVCGGSVLCEWCSGPAYLPYCRRNDEACLSRCVDVAPYNPAICLVPSVGGTCQWCGGLGYCVDADDAATLRCASRCETMIWRRDVCEGALACHWCPQHGGRCKPVKGRTQGYVGWRGESECDTGTLSASVSAPASQSRSASGAVSVTTSLSRLVSQSVTQRTPSASRRVSLTATTSPSLTLTLLPSSSQTLQLTPSRSLTLSTSLSQSSTASRTVAATHTLTHLPSSTPTATRTVPLRPPRPRLLSVAELEVATGVTLGLSLLAAAGGVAGISFATAGGRLKAVQAMSQCSYNHSERLDRLTSPTGLAFGVRYGGYYRGGVVGTVASVAGVCLLGAAGCLGYHALFPSPTAVLQRFHVPSALLLPYAIVVEGLVVVSVAALVHAQDGGDYGVGALGCVLALCVLLCCWRAVQGLRSLVLDGSRREQHVLYPYAWLRRLAVPSGEWTAGSGEDEKRLASAWYLLDGSGTRWYVALELSVTAGCGVAEGVRLEGDAACWAVAVVVLLLAVLLTGVVAWQRPALVLLDAVFLYAATAVFLAASVLLVAENATDDDAVSLATQGAAVVGIVVVMCRHAAACVVWVVLHVVKRKLLHSKVVQPSAVASLAEDTERAGTEGAEMETLFQWLADGVHASKPITCELLGDDFMSEVESLHLKSTDVDDLKSAWATGDTDLCATRKPNWVLSGVINREAENEVDESMLAVDDGRVYLQLLEMQQERDHSVSEGDRMAAHCSDEMNVRWLPGSALPIRTSKR